MYFNGKMDVVLSLPFLSEILSQIAMEQEQFSDETQTLIVKAIDWDESRQLYIADCDIYKESVH